MNTVTATFQNLDYDKFEQLMADAKFLNLSLQSFRVEDEMYLNLVLKGNYTMIQTMSSWIQNPVNWLEKALQV